MPELFLAIYVRDCVAEDQKLWHPHEIEVTEVTLDVHVLCPSVCKACGLFQIFVKYLLFDDCRRLGQIGPQYDMVHICLLHAVHVGGKINCAHLIWGGFNQL